MHRMDYVYNYFSNNSDATHDFNSKPWGLAEWGCHGMSQSLAYNVCLLLSFYYHLFYLLHSFF